MKQNTIKLILLLVLLSSSHIAFAVKESIGIFIDPLALLSGVKRVSVEYRTEYEEGLGDEEGVGVDYLSSNVNIGNSSLSITGIHLYVRKYFNHDDNDWIAGAGHACLILQDNTNLSSHCYIRQRSKWLASTSGFTIEGGYQWKWENSFQELVYEVWKLGPLEDEYGNYVNDGNVGDIGNVAGLTFRFGVYF